MIRHGQLDTQRAAQDADSTLFTTTSDFISIADMAPRHSQHDAPNPSPKLSGLYGKPFSDHVSPPSAFFPPPRTSSPQAMGQSPSRSTSPPLPAPQTSAVASISSQFAQASLSTTARLKRVLGGRRNKSVDSNKFFAPSAPSSFSKGKAKEFSRHDSIVSNSDVEFASSSPTGSAVSHDQYRPPSRQGNSAKQLTLQLASSTMQAIKGKMIRSSSLALPPQSPLPPPVPPKPDNASSPASTTGETTRDSRISADLISEPGRLSSSIAPMMQRDVEAPERTGISLVDITDQAVAKTVALEPSNAASTAGSGDVIAPRRRERREGRGELAKEAEDWRKSDSTVRTVRLVGSRTPRPLSLAESTNSGNTVQPSSGTPPASRRLSALLIDADFAMAEVESEDESDSSPAQVLSFQLSDNETTPSFPLQRTFPMGKSQTRRSFSVHLAKLSPKNRSKHAEADHWSSDSEALSSSASTGTANSSTTSITSSPPGSDTASGKHMSTAHVDEFAAGSGPDSVEASSKHSHDGFAPWVTASRSSTSSVSLSTSTSSSKDLPPMPVSAQPDAFPEAARMSSRQLHHASAAAQLRGLRSTAVSLTNGFAPAAGLAKGLGKRLGRAFGSSTSISDSSSLHRKGDSTSGRFSPRPSVAATSSQSDTEGAPPPAGPFLGRLLRGPRYYGARGLVFGRVLVDCVADTAPVLPSRRSREGRPKSERRTSTLSIGVTDARALESRRLPALALRCAQHLVQWGVQEEGLFRVSGRSTHVAKLRAEFDSGADYDMSECGPGDIDPHAVASIFKAYLRELPEPLLTRSLIPYFEAAMSAENRIISESLSESSVHDRSLKGLRKPPSLSTFTLPNFSSRKHSASLLSALASLIAQLPVENRDLLRTVAELIKITAKRSKETKMPLSNLMLVFCPSLSMSPPLLRVLCEGNGIWDGPLEGASPEDPIVLDIKMPDADPKEHADPADDEDVVVYDVGKAASTEKDERDQSHSEDDFSDESAPIFVPRSIIRRTPSSNASDDAHAGEAEAATVDDVTTPPTDKLSHFVSLGDSARLDVGSAQKVPQTNSSLYNLYSPPPLTLSSTAVSTPTSVGVESSGSNSEPKTPSRSRTMRKQSDLSSPFLRSVRKSLIGNPISFPQSGSAPVTPVGLKPSLTLTTSTSSPDLGPRSATFSNSPRRRKKPSLHDLFPKRSLSSLLSRPLSSVPPDSPMSFTTAPQSRTVSECPVLDLAVTYSPIKLDAEDPFGLQGWIGDSRRASEKAHVEPRQDPGDAGPKGKDADDTFSVATPRLNVDVAPSTIKRYSSTSSFTPSVFYTPLSRHQALTPSPSMRASNSTDSYSFLNFDFKEAEVGEAEDWAKSVLLAAEEEPSRTKS